MPSFCTEVAATRHSTASRTGRLLMSSPVKVATPPPPTQAPPSRRNRHELEFLPAALEIVEIPPSPAGRATALALSGFLVVALVWAWFGHVDVVAVAEGRIVPDEGSKLIQPKELGVVRDIHV